MSSYRLVRLCQKELKETLRDRRTILTLLVMPLLVYPILSMALNRFVLAAGQPSSEYLIGVTSTAELNRIDQWLGDPRSAPPPAILQASGGEVARFRAVVLPQESLAEALEERLIDVGILIEDTQSSSPSITLICLRENVASEQARRILVERLQWLQLSAATERLRELDEPWEEPVDIRLADTGTATAASPLATMVPLILVLMTITGAVYPAIDLTAGERERGTLEAVMASPVSRGAILFAKYSAVVVVALLTAMVNLAAMFMTLWAAGLMQLLTGDDAFPWIAALRVLGLLILFSMFYSALLLSLTSFAKSFKEAQAYLIPVMLISLAPAMLSLLPGATLSSALAVMPLINIVLLARDLLSGSVDAAGAAATTVSTIAYAVAALAIAARLFGSNAVERTSQQSIGSLLRRPASARTVPTPAGAALMLALLVPVYFLISNGLMRFLGQYGEQLGIQTQLGLNAAALMASFGLVPLLAAWAGRARLVTTYRLNPAGPVAIVGAAIVGLGGWAFAHEAFVIADQLGLGGLDEKQVSAAQETITKLRQAPLALLLVVFAVAPAVVEELCFRGYLFSALRSVLTPLRTVLATAILFGLFHVLTGSALLIERFIPSTFMGLIIGVAAIRSGSVFPGMVIHLVHNALLMSVLYYQDQLTFLGTDLDRQKHLPMSWLAIAALLLLVGTWLIRKRYPRL